MSKTTILILPAILLLILLLSVGVRAVYFIRRRGVISKKGNDFEILDE